jgi:hypothetical protein
MFEKRTHEKLSTKQLVFYYLLSIQLTSRNICPAAFAVYVTINLVVIFQLSVRSSRQ